MDQKDIQATKEKSIRPGRILDSNYEKSDLEQDVNKLIHLTKSQQLILLSDLKRYRDLFDGNIGDWNGPQIEIPLKDMAKPTMYEVSPFRSSVQKLKKYVDRLVAIVVLVKIKRSEWASSSLITPKKDGRVILISIFS